MFRATIRAGQLFFGGPIIRKRYEEWLDANDGKTVTIELAKHVRSDSQHRFYWVYLGVIERETGENADDLHEFFKRKLLLPVFKTIRGEEVQLPRSTKDLSKEEFSDYLTKISVLTEIPLPDPTEAGYISNY